MKQEAKTSLQNKCVSASFRRLMSTVMVGLTRKQQHFLKQIPERMFFCNWGINNAFKANSSTGHISLDEFIRGAQKSAWVQNFLRLDVNPSGWIRRYLCDRKLMSGSSSWWEFLWRETWKVLGKWWPDYWLLKSVWHFPKSVRKDCICVWFTCLM